MDRGAQTPEELEMLFEDSLLLRDPKSLIALFADGAALVIDGQEAVRGKDIARLALATWNGDQAYVGHPHHVIQARNMALIISEQGINVVRRNRHGSWQYIIVCQRRLD